MIKLKELRKKLKLTQGKVAEDNDLSIQVLSRYELGEREPDYVTLKKLAKYFDVTIDYLLEQADDPSPVHPANEVAIGNFVMMPIIGSISAGYDGEAVEEELGETPVPPMSLHGYPPTDCFVLRVNGNSMYPDYHDKDLVLVHRQASIDSGNVAVVMYNGEEATLKKVVYKNNENWMELIPRNPEYMPKRIEGTDLQECLILGKVLGIVWRDA